MVLAELGSQIKGAINKLQSATVIDEEALDAVLKEICAALMHSDVNIRIVQKIRTNIKAVCDFEELAQGTNKRKLGSETPTHESPVAARDRPGVWLSDHAAAAAAGTKF